jgi:hypothetical protein
MAEWCISHGISPDEYFDASEDERKQLLKDLAQDYYKKGLTEAFQTRLDKMEIWRDIDPIVATYAESKTIEPKLVALERTVGEVNTRRELTRAREQLSEIPRDRLTSHDRIARVEQIEGTLNTVENVITSLEEEIGMLGRAPAVTTDEQRNVNALLREARARNITSAGGQVIGESRVRYRSEAPARTFTIREYPIRFDEKSGVWSEQSRYRVYREDTGEQIGAWDHKPNADEIRQRWREH